MLLGVGCVLVLASVVSVLTFFAINVCLKDPVLVIELNAPSIAEDQISVQLNKGTVL
jgi:hypothetical protein